MWATVLEFVTKNVNAIALLLVGALIGLLVNKIAPWIFHQAQSISAAFLALVSGRWQDYRFERQYLNCLIGVHRYLGQLPSNVAVATGEHAQWAELEKVYVSLSFTPSGVTSSEERAFQDAGELRRLRRPSWWVRFIPERFHRKEERIRAHVLLCWLVRPGDKRGVPQR